MTALSWSLWSFGMHTLAHLPSATLLSLLYIFCLLLLSFSFSIPFSFFFTTPVILTAAVSYLDWSRAYCDDCHMQLVQMPSGTSYLTLPSSSQRQVLFRYVSLTALYWCAFVSWWICDFVFVCILVLFFNSCLILFFFVINVFSIWIRVSGNRCNGTTALPLALVIGLRNGFSSITHKELEGCYFLSFFKVIVC